MLNLIAASAYFLLIHFGVSGTNVQIVPLRGEVVSWSTSLVGSMSAKQERRWSLSVWYMNSSNGCVHRLTD